jgi:hypothetical protein
MEAKLLLTREKAATLYSLIHLMTGAVAFRAKREEVQKKLSKAWPEILETTPASADDRDLKEKREVILNEREQKAMGEGLLSLVTKENANGADFTNCLELASVLRISTWYRKATTVQEVPEFDEALDEEVVSDPEAAE